MKFDVIRSSQCNGRVKDCALIDMLHNDETDRFELEVQTAEGLVHYAARLPYPVSFANTEPKGGTLVVMHVHDEPLEA